MSKAKRELQNRIGLAFKREGLVLQGGATVELIVEHMRQHRDEEDFLRLLLRAVDRRLLRQNFVDEAAVQRAAGLITMDVSQKVEEESLTVLGALDCPRHRYHETRKTFLPLAGRPRLHGTADDQAEMFRHRFELIRQRVMRHPLFAKHKLTTVKSLLGATGRKIVFGMLTRNSVGELILEDLNNTVVIDIADAKIEQGLYTDHCMVLADGELKHGKFVVHVLTMPPLEEAATTLTTFANVDLFGGAPDAALRHEIEVYQKNAEHVMLVVLSDVWLDKPGTMAKLETLFEGYRDIVPTAFIFMGNYTSRPFAQTSEDVTKLQASFQGLTRLIMKFKSLALGSKWIFSRGPVDAGGPIVFPQFALPDFFVNSLKQRLPDVVFTTNPFRLRWCNVKMVFFRENIISKMRRHTLFPKLLLDGNPAEMLVKTLMEQSHLCPMPQAISPLYWNLDQSLSLYPIPDLVVLGDTYDQYVIREKEYLACNPGSFSADFSFIVVRPASMEVEESRIPDGSDDDIGPDEDETGHVPDVGEELARDDENGGDRGDGGEGDADGMVDQDSDDSADIVPGEESPDKGASGSEDDGQDEEEDLEDDNDVEMDKAANDDNHDDNDDDDNQMVLSE